MSARGNFETSNSDIVLDNCIKINVRAAEAHSSWRHLQRDARKERGKWRMLQANDVIIPLRAVCSESVTWKQHFIRQCAAIETI